jgi:hypothetical protein
MADSDAILVCGPRDGTVFAAPDSGLVEVPIHGQIRNAQPDVQAPDGHLGSGT